MDIDRIRYFHVFAQTGSLVKASELLHISQPALSKALRLLEQEVGTSLLEQYGRGLRLTAAGRKLITSTAPLLDQWMKVPATLAAVEMDLAPTRLGSFEVFTTYFLSHLLHHIDLGPLELHSFGAGQLEKAVAEGVIDIGITYLPIPKQDVEFVEAGKIKMSVFGLKKFKHQALRELPFVVPLMPAEGTPSKMQGLDGWPDHKYPRRIQYRVAMMSSALELCRQGLCVAYLPEFIVELHNKQVLPELRLIEQHCPIPLKDRKQSVFLIQRQNEKESTLLRQIAKAIRTLA